MRLEWLISFYQLSDALIVMRSYSLTGLSGFFCSQFTNLHRKLTLHHYNHCPEITLHEQRPFEALPGHLMAAEN